MVHTDMSPYHMQGSKKPKAQGGKTPKAATG